MDCIALMNKVESMNVHDRAEYAQGLTRLICDMYRAESAYERKMGKSSGSTAQALKMLLEYGEEYR